MPSHPTDDSLVSHCSSLIRAVSRSLLSHVFSPVLDGLVPSSTSSPVDPGTSRKAHSLVGDLCKVKVTVSE